MSKHQLTLTILAVALMLTATTLFGAVPSTMSYQGQLLDSGGEPITAYVPMTFAIYDSETSGGLLWMETHPDVNVESGMFSAVLGSAGNPIPDTAFAAENAWLEITVAGEPIDPRTRLTSMPYTFAAKSVKGDFDTEPGLITLSDAAKSGRFLQLSSASTGNYITMNPANPDDESRFSMLDSDLQNPPMMEMRADGFGAREFSMYMTEPGATGAINFFNVPQGIPDTCLQISFNPTTGASIRMGEPYDEGKSPVLISAHPSNGASIRMGEPWDERTLVEVSAAPTTGGSILMFNPQPEPPATAVMALYRSVLSFKHDCSGKVNLLTSYAKCGLSIGEPDGETLKVAGTTGAIIIDTLMTVNETGIYMKSALGKADYDAYLTPTGFKMGEGASLGHVLTSDADGIGTWQPSTGGSGTPSGVAQAIDATDFDTLYSADRKTFISQSIDCPSSGYVLVMGSCDATVLHHGSSGDPMFIFGVSNAFDTLDADQRKEWRIDDYVTFGTAYFSDIISAQKIYPVSEGLNTFYMVGYRSNATGCTDSCRIDNKTLSLVYIPESYGTVELSAMGGDFEDEIFESAAFDVSPRAIETRSGTEMIEQLKSEVEELKALVNELIENR